MKKIFTALLLSFILSGCGTIMHRSGKFGPPEPTLYPAVQVDTGMLRHGLDEMSGSTIQQCLVGTCFILDIPFSIVTDTICLPYDVWKYSSRTHKDEE